MSLRIERLTGPQITGAIPALSRLRLDVFREWPYLYDGDAVNEAFCGVLPLEAVMGSGADAELIGTRAVQKTLANRLVRPRLFEQCLICARQQQRLAVLAQSHAAIPRGVVLDVT